MLSAYSPHQKTTSGVSEGYPSRRRKPLLFLLPNKVHRGKSFYTIPNNAMQTLDIIFQFGVVISSLAVVSRQKISIRNPEKIEETPVSGDLIETSDINQFSNILLE